MREKEVRQEGSESGRFDRKEQEGRCKLTNPCLPSLCQVVTRRERWSCASAKILPAGNERGTDVLLVFLLPPCLPRLGGKSLSTALLVIITWHSVTNTPPLPTLSHSQLGEKEAGKETGERTKTK